MASWVDRVCARVSHDGRVSQPEGSCATMSATPLLRPKDVLVSASPNAATGEPCAGTRVYTATVRRGALQHNGSVDGDKNWVREEQGIPEEKTVAWGANRSFATRPVDIRQPSRTFPATGKPQHADSVVTASTNGKDKLLHFSTNGEECRHMLCAAKSVENQESQAPRVAATTTTSTLERQVPQSCSAQLPEVQGACANLLNKQSQPDLHSIGRSPWLEALLSSSSHSAVKPLQSSHQQQQQQTKSPRHGSSSDVRQKSTQNDIVEPNPATEPGATGVPVSSRETHDGKGKAMGVEPRKTALDTEAGSQTSKPSGWAHDVSGLVAREEETSPRPASLTTGKPTAASQSNAPWLRALLSAPAPAPLSSKCSQSSCPQTISRGCARPGTSDTVSHGWVGGSKLSGTAVLSSAPVASSPFVGCGAPGKDALKTSGSPRPSSPELIPATSGSQGEDPWVLEGADEENQESEGVDDDSNSSGVVEERDGAAHRRDERVNDAPEGRIEEGEVFNPKEESSAPNKTNRRIYFGSEHGKVKFLFPNMSPGRRDQLQFDEESLWSVTDQNTADEITKIALMLPGVTSRTTIVDGTACVGGNVVSFAEAFAEVWAVEIDRNRFELLVSNVENCLGGPGNPAGVRFLNCDFLNVLQQEKKEIGAKRAVIFLDPPWGGVDYKKQDVVDLFLSGVSLADVCGRAAEAGARHVLVKVPTNFNLRSFRMAVGLAGRITVYERNLRKMLLIAVEFYCSSSPSSPSSRAMSRRASETPAGSPSFVDSRARSESEGGRDGRRVGACLGSGVSFPSERYRQRQRGDDGIAGCWGGKPSNHRVLLAPGTSSSSGGCGRWEGRGGSCLPRPAATAYEGGDEPMGSWIKRRANARATSQREKQEREGVEAMYTTRVEHEAVYSERMNSRPGAGGVGVLQRYGGRRRFRGGADARSVENVRKMLMEVLGLDGNEDGRGAPSREPCSGVDGRNEECKVNNMGCEMAAGEGEDSVGGLGEVGRGAAGSPAEDEGHE